MIQITQDLKSCCHCGSAGSIPAPGTKLKRYTDKRFGFFYSRKYSTKTTNCGNGSEEIMQSWEVRLRILTYLPTCYSPLNKWQPGECEPMWKLYSSAISNNLHHQKSNKDIRYMYMKQVKTFGIPCIACKEYSWHNKIRYSKYRRRNVL